MLHTIFIEALNYIEEDYSANAGWGTTIDEMVQDYCDAGGSWRLLRKVLNLAYYKEIEYRTQPSVNLS